MSQQQVETKRIMVNGLHCPRCKEKIWSRHRHDFRHCLCGYCFVDGGRDYMRFGWGVGLPEGRHNDGTVTKEEWAAVEAQNKEIGKPKQIRMRVEVPVQKPKDPAFPYSGWMGLYLAAEVAALNAEKEPTTTRTSKGKKNELPKSRNRKQASSVRSGTGGSKLRPSKPVRGSKDKASVRK